MVNEWKQSTRHLPQPRVVSGFIVEATVTRKPESINALAYLFGESLNHIEIVPGCQSRFTKSTREKIGKEETQGKIVAAVMNMQRRLLEIKY